MVPSCGARISSFCSWSWAAILRSDSSLNFDSSSLSCLATSLRMSWSTCRICSCAWAISAPTWPAAERSWPSCPSYWAACRSTALMRSAGTSCLFSGTQAVELALGELRLALDRVLLCDDADRPAARARRSSCAAGPAGPGARRGAIRTGVVSILISSATAGSLARASTSSGKVSLSSPSRSACRRVLRTAISSRPLE